MAGEITTDEIDDVISDDRITDADDQDKPLTADEKDARRASARRAIERMRDSEELRALLEDDFDHYDQNDNFA